MCRNIKPLFNFDPPTTEEEIRAASLQFVRKISGPEKSFADQMIADHTKTSTELSQTAQAANVPVPKALDSSHQKMLDKLNSESGDTFRRDYFSDQVSAHEDAVSLFQRYGDKGGKR